MTTELATRNEQNPISAMLQAIIDKGITAETAATMEKMTELYWKVEAKRAEQEFNAAFAKMQAELPEIIASKMVPGNMPGSVRYSYEPLDKIKKAVKPILMKYGFGYSFDHEMSDGRVISTCTLSHMGGHCRVGRSIRKYGKGPPGTNDAQADGSTDEYADRGAFCAALGISVHKDNDARGEGDFITQQQADELRARLKAVGKPEGPFLAVACTESFEKITDDKYEVLDQMLKAAERGKQPPPQTAPMTWDMLHAQMVEIAMDAKPPIANSLFDKLLAKAQEINPAKYPAIVQAAKDGKLNWITHEIKA